MNIAHPKTNIRRTFLKKLCFDFMADNIAIELGFRQQVAAEALNIFRTSKTRLFRFRRSRGRIASGQF
jgi:tRNA(Ile)-lysidine synthase TilS/MesJ